MKAFIQNEDALTTYHKERRPPVVTGGASIDSGETAFLCMLPNHHLILLEYIDQFYNVPLLFYLCQRHRRIKDRNLRPLVWAELNHQAVEIDPFIVYTQPWLNVLRHQNSLFLEVVVVLYRSELHWRSFLSDGPTPVDRRSLGKHCRVGAYGNRVQVFIF